MIAAGMRSPKGAQAVVIDAATWPAVRQLTQRWDVSQVYVNRLIRDGRLAAVRTPLGYFVNPASADAYERERAERATARTFGHGVARGWYAR
jgi:hypothetical protein